MTLDTTLLGRLTAEVMESVADMFEDDYHVRTCALIVEVDSPKRGQIIVRCSDDRPWLLEALLHEAENSVIEMRAQAVAASGDDDE